MDQDIFEFAIIRTVAILPEPENSATRETTAFAFVWTHSTEQIEEMIKRLKIFSFAETIANPDNESSKWLNLFIDSIRQKTGEKNIKID